MWFSSFYLVNIVVQSVCHSKLPHDIRLVFYKSSHLLFICSICQYAIRKPNNVRHVKITHSIDKQGASNLHVFLLSQEEELKGNKTAELHQKYLNVSGSKIGTGAYKQLTFFPTHPCFQCLKCCYIGKNEKH